MGWLEGRFEESVMVTTLEQGIAWARESSMWPMTFGLACCAIEMMAVGGPRYDMDRFGAGAFRATPRQADLMVVAGTVNYKMASPRAPALQPDARSRSSSSPWAPAPAAAGRITSTATTSSRALTWSCRSMSIVPGCPPRPEALLEGLMRIQDKVRGMRYLTKGKAIDVPIPARTGYVQLPPELERRRSASRPSKSKSLMRR